MALLFSLAAETHYSCVSFSMTPSPAPGSAAGRSDTGSVGAFFLLPVLQASDSCARVLQFPLDRYPYNKGPNWEKFPVQISTKAKIVSEDVNL